MLAVRCITNKIVTSQWGFLCDVFGVIGVGHVPRYRER